MPKFFARQYFLGVFVFILACGFLLQCKPRRTSNNFSSESNGDVCEKPDIDETIGKAACDSAVYLQALQKSDYFLQNPPELFEASISSKIDQSLRYDEQLSYLGIYLAGLGNPSFRIKKHGDAFDASVENFKKKLQSIISSDKQNYWSEEAKKLYKICPTPIQCSYWDAHVFAVQGRVPELYDTFIQLAKDIAEDLYSDTVDEKVQSPETHAFMNKMVFDLRALEIEFQQITNFEAIEVAQSSTKHPEANPEEIKNFKQRLDAKLRYYRSKVLDETSDPNANLIRRELSAAYLGEIEIVNREEANLYGPEFDPIEFDQKDLNQDVLTFEQSVYLLLADFQALSWYCDRIDVQDYFKIDAWMDEKIALANEKKDVSTYEIVLPFTSLLRMVEKFLEREVQLPSLDVFLKAVNFLHGRQPSVGYYSTNASYDFYFDQKKVLESLKKVYEGNSKNSYKKQREEQLLKALYDLGVPEIVGRRLISNEKRLTKHRGFHSLPYQLSQLQQATQRVKILQEIMFDQNKINTREKAEASNNNINEQMNELAAKSLKLLCLDSYYSNASEKIIKATDLQMDTSFNPLWCGGQTGASIWSGVSSQCPLQKNNQLNLAEICPRYSPELGINVIEGKTFECIVGNKVAQSCAQKVHELAMTTISTIALPGVGATASALTKLTFAAGRSLLGGSVGIAVQASRAPAFLGWLLHTSVEGAYFGSVNSVLLSPLIGINNAFYNKNMSLYENGVGTLKSYLWSFAFFGFSRQMDNISKMIHKKATSSVIGLRLKLGGRSNPEVMKSYIEYYRNFKRGDQLQQQIHNSANRADFGWWRSQKSVWSKSGELNQILPPSYKWWAIAKNTSRFSTELFGFRAIEIVDHKTSPYFDQFMGIESLGHSDMHIDRTWSDWSQEEGTALMNTLATVLSFRVKFWHHTYDRKVLKPFVLPMQAKLDSIVKTRGPMFRFGIGSKKALAVTKSKEAHEKFLKQADEYYKEQMMLLQGDLQQISEYHSSDKKNQNKKDPNISYIEKQMINLKQDYEVIKNFDKMKTLANDMNKF